MIEGQCAEEGSEITSYQPFQFTGDCQVSLSFEPNDIPGWKRQFIDFHTSYVNFNINL